MNNCRHIYGESHPEGEPICAMCKKPWAQVREERGLITPDNRTDALENVLRAFLADHVSAAEHQSYGRNSICGCRMCDEGEEALDAPKDPSV